MVFDLDEFAYQVDLQIARQLSDEEAVTDALMAYSEEIMRLGGRRPPEPPEARSSSTSDPGDAEDEPRVVSYCRTLAEHRRRRRPRTKTGDAFSYAPVSARGNRPIVTYDMLRPKCYHCGSRDLFDDRDFSGDLICRSCATCTPDNITTNAFKCMHFDDYGAMKSTVDAGARKNHYKRDNYFGDLITQLLGRQNAKIPDHVYARVRQDLRDTCPTCINGKTVKHALKKSRLGKFYEHAHMIANAITGNACLVRLDHVEEETLHRMFRKIQKTFERHKGDRKNCLNYPYVLWQFFVLIGRRDLCDHVDMLKCQTRLRRHDELWRLVCQDVGWEYIPVVTAKQPNIP